MFQKKVSVSIELTMTRFSAKKVLFFAQSKKKVRAKKGARPEKQKKSKRKWQVFREISWKVYSLEKIFRAARGEKQRKSKKVAGFPRNPPKKVYPLKKIPALRAAKSKKSK